MGQLGSFLETTSKWMRQQHSPPEGYKYATMYEYVLAEGREFKSSRLTRAEWDAVLRQVQHNEAKQCFANCQRAMFWSAESLFDWASMPNKDQPFEYVEGYVISDIAIPIHHAWLSIHNKVVDPTLKFWRTKPYRRKTHPDRVMGTIPKGWEYYGVVIEPKRVLECIKRNKAWHTVLDDWSNGFPLLKEKT